MNYWGNKNGLLTDKNGNIYSYGSKNITYYDTLGSFLQSYNNNGILIFSKHWKIPFHIQKMEYDGNDYFYFVGNFTNTQLAKY